MCVFVRVRVSVRVWYSYGGFKKKYLYIRMESRWHLAFIDIGILGHFPLYKWRIIGWDVTIRQIGEV